MAYQLIPDHPPFLYPDVDQSNPDSISPLNSTPNPNVEPAPFEETIITIPGAIVHLIDDHRSVELANGEFSVVKISDGDCVVALLARVGDDFQWPLLKDEAAVKLDSSHYFFSLKSPVSVAGSGSDSDVEIEQLEKGNVNEEKHIGKLDYIVLNYGLSFTSKGEEEQLEALERVLQSRTAFTAQCIAVENDVTLVSEASPEERSAAYWTTLAPNVEDYGGAAAKLIVVGSGQLIRGILWCGDVTVERLKWGDEILKKKMGSCHKVEISPKTMRRIKRAKRVAKTTEKVAEGVMNGVVKIAEYLTSSAVNTNVGRKFFSNIPGEILLASLDGFNKICDAIEVAGKNVMSTSTTVTTSLVTHKYGEQAGEVTQDGLDTAGHAIWTAWTVYKIRKVLNPKGVYKKTTLVKCTAEAVADEYKAKRDSSKPKS